MVCLCVCPIAVIGAVLRHSPLIPEGDRGGALRETSVWSVLSCGFLWTGEALNHSTLEIIFCIYKKKKCSCYLNPLVPNYDPEAELLISISFIFNVEILTL